MLSKPDQLSGLAYSRVHRCVFSRLDVRHVQIGFPRVNQLAFFGQCLVLVAEQLDRYRRKLIEAVVLGPPSDRWLGVSFIPSFESPEPTGLTLS